MALKKLLYLQPIKIKMENLLSLLNRKKVFLIISILVLSIYLMSQIILPLLNKDNTLLNITGYLLSIALLLSLTYVLPKIVKYTKKVKVAISENKNN